jgi:hypothetical protein
MSPQSPQDIVLASILNCFPSPTVEQRLSLSAELTHDLALTKREIILIGLEIENRLQILLNKFIHIPDECIMAWRSVQDIINSVSGLMIGE